MNYDLEERTAVFAEIVISICQSTRKKLVVRPIITQLVRSATSAGANYREANGAISKKEFRHKIHLSKKELKETDYWLRLLQHSQPEIKSDLKPLRKECNELIRIFQKITMTLDRNKNN